MPDIDAQLLLRAFDIAAHGGDSTVFPRMCSVYKVLTPGPQAARLTPEIVVAHGYHIDRSVSGMQNNVAGYVVGRPRDAGARLNPDADGLLELAYHFGLAANTTQAGVDAQQPPYADGAEFSRFSAALHMLSPSARSGIKLRNALELHEHWRIDCHTASTQRLAYSRMATVEDGLDGEDVGYCHVLCEADHPGAQAYTTHTPGVPIYYVRPRDLAEQAYQVYLVENGRRVRAYEGKDFAQPINVWCWLAGMSTFLVNDGTRLEIVGMRDAHSQGVVYHRGVGWLLDNAQPIPRVEWLYDHDDTPALHYWDSLSPARQAEIETVRGRERQRLLEQEQAMPRRRRIV